MDFPHSLLELSFWEFTDVDSAVVSQADMLLFLIHYIPFTSVWVKRSISAWDTTAESTSVNSQKDNSNKLCEHNLQCVFLSNYVAEIDILNNTLSLYDTVK